MSLDGVPNDYAWDHRQWPNQD